MSTTALSIIAIFSAIIMAGYVSLQKQPRSLNRWLLVLGLVLMAIAEGADCVALNRPDMWSSAKAVTVLAESLLGVVWLSFALTYARKNPLRDVSRLSWVLVIGSLILPVIALTVSLENFFYSPDFADEHVLFLNKSSYWFYLGVLLSAVAALYHMERILLALSPRERSGVLFEILGIGIILVAILTYYSQALLYRTIDMNLMPARSLALLVGVGLAGYSFGKRSSEQSLLISRDVASRSIVILAVGCYLLLLGGAGESLRYFGISDQRALFTGFAILSGLVLVILLLSEKNRRKLKVFLHKHFYKLKYDYRNEWLMFTAQLSSADNMDKLQKAILTFYCETFGRRGASLYLRERESAAYRQKTSLSLEFPQTSFFANHPMVAYLNETDRIFSIEDQHSSQMDEIKRQLAPFNIKLCVPLQYEHDLEGFIMLGEAINTDEALTFEDFDLMKVLASQATSVLLSAKLSAQLSIAQELAAIGKVSTFVIHDLKNHVSSLSLMVDNAREHMDNPEFQADMLETLDETIGKVNLLIARLKNIKEATDLNCTTCNLTDIVRSSAKAAGMSKTAVEGKEVTAHVDATEIEKVVHNLILNALESGSGDNSVKINVGRDESAYIEVRDQGCGMSEDFIRNRLFQPFQTTKKKGLGIGLYQCRQIVESHGGKIEVSSQLGEGSVFKVKLPLLTDLQRVTSAS